VPITIPDELLAAAGLNEAELKQELAVALFQRDRITLAQASRLAGMNQLQFQTLLAEREIPVHYGVAEFEQDLHTLHRLGRA
jgi:predicted HTH domain antitoxin